jgi:predicted transcriptional regulator
MKHFGSELRRQQEEMGVSTMEVAVAADLHPQTLYRVYNGSRVSRATVNRVRKALEALREKSQQVARAV